MSVGGVDIRVEGMNISIDNQLVSANVRSVTSVSFTGVVNGRMVTVRKSVFNSLLSSYIDCNVCFCLNIKA